MDLESVTLKLPRDLLSGAQRVATARDVTIGHMVRVLLKREVDRQLSGKTRDAGLDARLLAAVQALLARDIAEAKDWTDLQNRLRPHGYELRPAGGGAVLYKSSCNTRVCKASELGFSYGALVERFGSHIPGHQPEKSAACIMPAGRIDQTRKAVITRHITAAKSWPDLINRLAIEGMELRALGDEIGIYASTTGRHLCNTADVGATCGGLTQRFGFKLPGTEAI